MPPSRETAVIHGMDHVQGNGGGTGIAKILQAIRHPIQREPQFLGEEIRHETVKTICDDLGLTVPDGYEEIEG